MPERRRKLLEDEWVIVSGERRDRPSDFQYRIEPASSSESCPFDPGEEHRTPPEVDRVPEPGDDELPWRARAVPNKFPAVRPDPSREGEDGSGDRTNPARGHQEVLVESPDHNRTLDQFEVEQARAVLKLYERRIRDLTDRSEVSSVRIFRNSGARAGGSLSHPHSQLVALPFVPNDVSHRRKIARERYREHQQCPVCRTISRASDSRARVVWQTEHFLVFCPYASEVPYETWVTPLAHRARFASPDESDRRELAKLLPELIGRLKDVLAEPAYNLVLRDDFAGTNPTPDEAKSHHWFLQLAPRIKVRGGFELSTGIPINSIPPEQAAQDLRKTLPT